MRSCVTATARVKPVALVLVTCHLTITWSHRSHPKPKENRCKTVHLNHKKLTKNDMYTKFQASTHSCTPLEIICTRTWEMYVPDFHDWFTIQKGWGKHVVIQKPPSSQHIFFDSWIVTFFYWCPISKLQKMDVNVSPYMDFHPTMVFQHLFSDKTPKFGRVHCYLPAAMNGC